ncbi:Mg2+ transporter protein, CorA-like/Zinc transport protein ZntB [Penicillium griseofulvum]|uniref:Mg2+ transporter protein, CorA-like/Zinc transport protein ZntB n=1 Tax=Penicillium patulum TaxID=5078 RepID=A0A135LG73_PENPA|nr:Mg2+ transporter protein, CorA-like/Zinc transport protein ZntB [Penicillium griseofulvum]KXG47977.1 Mg2+ transporter protein, CorA-like/Zinc transport protein ZntB [Penicillium griseofulvum]
MTSISFDSTRPHASDRSFSDEEDSPGDRVGMPSESEIDPVDTDYDKSPHSPSSEGVPPIDSGSKRRRKSVPRQNKEPRLAFVEDFDEDADHEDGEDEVESFDGHYSPSENTDTEYSSSESPDRDSRRMTNNHPRAWRPTPTNYSPSYSPEMSRSGWPSPGRQHRVRSRSKHVKNDYVRPVYVEDASSNLSVTVTLRSINGERWTNMAHPMAQPWMQAKSELAHGSKTEYFAIRAADHYADDVGDSMITLVCYDEDTPKQNELVQMRWLHLQQADSDLQMFEDLILHCPHVDTGLKSVALALLRDRGRPSGLSSLQWRPRENISRYDYRDNLGVWNEQSVTFMKVPFFTMKKKFKPVPGQTTSSSAVPLRYHTYMDNGLVDCDFWTTSTRSPVIGADSGDELYVTYLSCLLLGSGTIITCGDISASDVLASSITIDKMSKTAKQPCAIRIVDPESRHFYLVIELPLPYFEFMKHASNVVRLPNEELSHANLKLLTEDHDLLTPERWVDLMEREDLNNLQLQLIRDDEHSVESDDSGAEPISVRIHRSNQKVYKRGSNTTGKVVNDVQNIIPSKHYIIDSSSETEDFDGEGADQVQQTTTEKLTAKSSSVSSGTGDDAKHEASSFPKAESQRDRAVHFANDTHVCRSMDTTPVENAGSLSPPPTARAPLITHPFFTWNAVSYSTSRTSDGQSHVKVYNLLNQVDKSMARKRQRTERYLYRRGFECTMQELERRHPYLTSTLSNSVSDQIFEAKRDVLDETTRRADGFKGEGFHPVLEEDRNIDAIHHPSKWEDVVKNDLRPLFTLSKGVAQTFVPAEMEVVQRCWKKLWGSLDRILRCIELHYKLSNESTKYVVNSRMLNNFSVLGNTEEAVLNCTDCKEGTFYNDLQTTLDHLHEKHSQCQSCNKPKRLFDDPCTVWVKATMIGRKRKVLNSLFSKLVRVREFVQYLEILQQYAMDLQLSVQYAGSDGISQDVTSRLPFLPSTLVRGFEEFLLSTISLAHYLSRSGFIGRPSASERPSKIPLNLRRHERSREPSLYQKPDSSVHAGSRNSHTHASSHGVSGPSASNTRDAIVTQSSSMGKATFCMKQARRDLVLLSTTTSRAGGVNSTSISPEFLLAVMISNINSHINGKKTDLIQMYSRRMMRIANQTAQKPQRRLFLELYGLEDDMYAIRGVIFQQWAAISNYDRLLDPNSYRVTTKARRTLYEVEHDFIEKEQIRLEDRTLDVNGFLNGAAYYRNRIRQHIEILEEGHGKAIRVFTFVTVFFLPLSFCSSFMGMNTTDIRETKFDQTIFWEVAIPSTIVILALAFLYGYKWDYIYEWFIDWQEERMAKKQTRKLAERYGERDEQPRWRVLGEKLKMGERGSIQPEKDWRYFSGVAV